MHSYDLAFQRHAAMGFNAFVSLRVFFTKIMTDIFMSMANDQWLMGYCSKMPGRYETAAILSKEGISKLLSALWSMVFQLILGLQ